MRKLDYGKVIGYSIDCFDVELGWYKTKEKALNVLDRLQATACSIKYVEFLSMSCERNNANTIDCSEYVFNMPQDE